MTDAPEPVGRPLYDLMGDMLAFVPVMNEIGGAEFDRRLRAEIHEAMGEHGVRVVLWYSERMDDLSAVMAEFTT